MTKRKRVSNSAETDILVSSGRRCCLCFGLHNDLDVKAGQIAHLDRDPCNNNPDNLAYLCLPHHDWYDSHHSQSKGATRSEAIKYRARLYALIEKIRVATDGAAADSPSFRKSVEQLASVELPKRSRFYDLVELASKLSLSRDRDEQYVTLIELAIAHDEPARASAYIALLSLSSLRDEAWWQVFYYYLKRDHIGEAAAVAAKFSLSSLRDRALKEVIEMKKASGA